MLTARLSWRLLVSQLLLLGTALALLAVAISEGRSEGTDQTVPCKHFCSLTISGRSCEDRVLQRNEDASAAG